MSDPSPEPRPEPRWVKSEVIGSEPPPELPPPPGERPGEPPPEATGPVPVPDQPPVTEQEIAGARWFAIAFFVVVIPLGLVLFALIVWTFIRSIPL
jgi:hypothetical protein